MSEISFTLYEDKKVTESLSRETLTTPSNLLISLQDFQKKANDVLTSLIASKGENVDNVGNEGEEDISDKSENEVQKMTPKKRKV